MANDHFFKKNVLKVSHLPTMMLVIGYPVYWLELYFHKANRGVASPVASLLFLLLCTWVIFQKREWIIESIGNLKKFLVRADWPTKILVGTGLLLSFIILGCAFFASLYPPHLGQEFDALNYHLTVPRQHLILNSFNFLKWSSGDLFPLPLDFALAPYWLVTSLPNKVPQFIFLLGMIGVTLNLFRRIGGSGVQLLFLFFAIMGSHFYGIQMGTAMLDIVLCYLFIAALDSFLSGAIILGLIEFAFLFWSKSFVPPQMIILFMAVGFLGFILRKTSIIKKIRIAFSETDLLRLDLSRKTIVKAIMVFILISVIIGGPFIAKSIYYSGTPLFPFAPGLLGWHPNILSQEGFKEALIESSKLHMVPKYSYGHGKSLIPFVKHFWLIAVPERGVNNAFDYPMGLPYLIFIVPFVYFTVSALRKKEYTILPFFIIIYWIFWWFGSQQTRFLYIPILLMFIVVLPALKKPSKVLLGLLILAVCLNALSVVRAHKNTFRSSRSDVLRPQDKGLIRLAQKYYQEKRKEAVIIDFHDAAFAQFPVDVKEKGTAWVLSYP